MKRIFLFLMFLQTCAYSSIAFVQGDDTTNSASVTSFKIRYPSNVTAGNSLIVDVHSYSSNASHSIADSRGNTWQLIDTVYYSAQTEKVTRWRVKATTGGADTVTVTFGASLSYWRCAIMEYSGLDTSTLYYDTKDSINASLTANNQTGKVKINAIGDLVLSTIQITGTDATVTAGTGYTMRQSTTGTLNLYVEDTITTTTDSIMGKWTNSANGSTKWLALTTSFKASAACTAPSGFSYSTSPIKDTVGKAAATQTATITGTVDSFKVIGTALPGGLSLNKNTGAITGTPTTETAKAGYQIRAYGCLDSVSTYDTITVFAAPVDSGTFALTDMTANRVWQRQTAAGVPGGAQCSVTVAGRCKKYTTTIKALVRHIAGDTVVNWTTIATSPDSGNFSKKLSVPTGCWYKVSVCDNLGDTAHGSNRFGVGDVWLVIGQSNIMGWNANLSAARDTSSDSCVNFSRLNWQRMIDPMCDLGGSHGATPFVKLGKMLVAKTGYPHAFINAAKGGTKLNGDWDDRHAPLTDTSYLYNRAYQYASLSGGKIFGIIMGQGENDAKDGTSGATYQTKFDTIINRFRADLGFSTMPVFYFMIGRIPNFATTTNLAVIQNAQLALDDSTKKYYLCAAWWDLAMDTDSLHLTLASNDTLGKRFGVKISRWYDGVFDKYPKITSFSGSNLPRVIKLNTSAIQLTSIAQLPNLIITKKNGDTITSKGISVAGSIVYDTLNENYASDSCKAYYAANRFPSATYTLKDTGGFPIPQYWGPYYFSNHTICTLVVIAGTGGTVSRATIIDSTSRTFRDTATANSGYLFNKWTCRHGGVTFADSMSRYAAMTVTASDTVDASFRAWPTYTLTMAAGTGGTVLPATGSVDSAASTAISASPGTHYIFQKWTRSGTAATIADSSSASTTVILTGAATVTGNFTCVAPTISYATKITANYKTAITPQSATIGGGGADSVIAYGLPAGLLCVKTGVNMGQIYGTATELAAKAGYKVKAFGCVPDSTYDTITVSDNIPVITSATPSHRPTTTAGNDTLRGSWLANLDTVWYGTTASTTFGTQTDTTAIVAIPNHAAGIVSIIIRNTAGRDTLVNGFEYKNLWINSVTPSRVRAGDTVSIHAAYGLGTSGLGITVGDSTATLITGYKDTLAKFLAPTYTTGTKTITVTNTGGDTCTANIDYIQSVKNNRGRWISFGFDLGLR